MKRHIHEAVVIGASAGAFEALSAILKALPKNFKLPIMIVVHLPADKKSIFAELFDRSCKITVQEAEDKVPIEPGTAYFAPPDYHLLIEQNRSLALSSDLPVLFSRPSIDVLFESAADAYGAGLIGIVLTGANSDGARGLRAIEDAGGISIVQNPWEAYAAAMPTAALALCSNAECLSLREISEFMQKAGQNDID